MASVQEALDIVAEMMRDTGFEILEEVRIVVDEKLPFMGYTTPQGWQNHVIVVSGLALESGMVEGLLIHEMSHIYRIQTKHPSHNQRIISEVISLIVRKGLKKDYQLQALHIAVNHLQDLYADDISFKVFKKNQSKLFSLDRMSEFFQGWLKSDPAKSRNEDLDKWTNASILLNNVFALSNMRRHSIPDLNNRARDLNQRFLSLIPREAAERSDYFEEVMVNLEEGASEMDFRNLLCAYSAAFLDLVQRM